MRSQAEHRGARARPEVRKDFSFRKDPIDTPVLCLMADPNAGHPDYREEWRP
ncbi:DUF6221 family protein [Modestobacter sp. VKM Ac-2985]|uniref:DUF6221 family protein n=1 Tax=Modestobacter sp. VKM Ac-2985 TaxID=3004139 RepID=UPI003FA5FF10